MGEPALLRYAETIGGESLRERVEKLLDAVPERLRERAVFHSIVRLCGVYDTTESSKRCTQCGTRILDAFVAAGMRR